MDLPRVTTLDSGVRVVTEHMDSVRSVALGFWIGTGSSAEDEPRAGLSHLIEHMLFRGTARYGSLEIDQIFDAMGAELNAGTGKETTSVYARVLDGHLPEALDVIADMVWRPRFAEDDLVNERQIVLEEIAMYEDDPQDKVFDVLGEAVFAGHPLGRAIIGRADVVAGTPADGLRAFHAERYVPGNVVVAAAGSVDHDDLVARVEQRRRSSGSARAVPSRRAAARADARAGALPAQGHRAGARLPRRPRASRATTSGATRCACSTRSSAARRPRGCSRRCARSAAWPTASTRSSRCSRAPGQIGLYLGTRPDNLARGAARRRRRARPRARGPGHAPRSSSARRRTSRAASSSGSSRPRRG